MHTQLATDVLHYPVTLCFLFFLLLLSLVSKCEQRPPLHERRSRDLIQGWVELDSSELAWNHHSVVSFWRPIHPPLPGYKLQSPSPSRFYQGIGSAPLKSRFGSPPHISRYRTKNPTTCSRNRLALEKWVIIYPSHLCLLLTHINDTKMNLLWAN